MSHGADPGAALPGEGMLAGHHSHGNPPELLSHFPKEDPECGRAQGLGEGVLMMQLVSHTAGQEDGVSPPCLHTDLQT